jgi:hypothetical protein
LHDYEEFIYTLREGYPSIQHSTLVVIRLGQRSAILERELTFAQAFRITVQEQLSSDTNAVVIDFYGYELWHGSTKIAWYDPQPHPNNPALASTHPHHKHVPPDIKHHRIPAPEMSFARPNLPALIREIEALIQQTLAESDQPNKPTEG